MGNAARSTPQTDTACPLSWAEQRRNLVLFACCTGLQYLAAPVLYVGITQAALCERLGATTRVANLPATLFFAMTAVPALIAWLSPQVAAIKRNLFLCYAIAATAQLALAVGLAMKASPEFTIALVILQGGVSGATIPTAIALLWEVVCRGADESKRGWALSLAFGAGPMLAVFGSLGQSYLLRPVAENAAADWSGFVTLFALGGPIMLTAAFLTQGFIVPPAVQETQREPVSKVVGLLLGVPSMFGAVALLQFQADAAESIRPWIGTMQALGYVLGVAAAICLVLHFRPILGQRTLLIATVVTILIYCANTIPSNMNLYTRLVLDASPQEYAGLQNTLRFGFKVAAGFFLGWFLTRTSPRAGMLATASLFLLAQVWAIFAVGRWYLLAFGIYGAGELIGVYAPNYIASASRKQELRRNMAFSTMLMVPAAPAGYLFGFLVDQVKVHQWTVGVQSPEVFGFRVSFTLCAMFILSGVVITLLCLPRHPSVSQGASDAAEPMSQEGVTGDIN